MPKLLVMVLLYVFEKVLSFAFKKVLVGAGIGLASFGITQLIFNSVLSYVQNNFAQLHSFFFLIDLCGLDVAISYVISAISIRITLTAGKLGFRKM